MTKQKTPAAIRAARRHVDAATRHLAQAAQFSTDAAIGDEGDCPLAELAHDTESALNTTKAASRMIGRALDDSRGAQRVSP